MTRMWCTLPCGRPWRSWVWPFLSTMCGGSCTPCSTSKRPPWRLCLPVWAPWILGASGPTWMRWMRCLHYLWPTCCRHGIRVTPTSASVVTTATHCLSSCMGHTAYGGSQLSSPSSPCRSWHQAPTSPTWPAFKCPDTEDLAPSSAPCLCPAQPASLQRE